MPARPEVIAWAQPFAAPASIRNERGPPRRVFLAVELECSGCNDSRGAYRLRRVRKRERTARISCDLRLGLTQMDSRQFKHRRPATRRTNGKESIDESDSGLDTSSDQDLHRRDDLVFLGVELLLGRRGGGLIDQ